MVKHNQKVDPSQLLDAVVTVNRVTKVNKGGRKFSFSALIIVGDRGGRIGYGLGKANEVTDAKRKGVQDAKKKVIKISLREGRTVHHDIMGHYGSSKIIIRAAPAGTGVVAGGPTRIIFDLLGIKDVVAKSLGSNNPHNIVRATFDALAKLQTPKEVAAARGLKIGVLLERRRLSNSHHVTNNNIKQDTELESE